MERLTKKEEWIDYAGFTNDKHNYWRDSNYCIEKLGQLEDIEEELGIDLITLFKALKEGIWYKFENANIRYIYVNYLDLGFYVDHFVFWLNETSSFNLKDYGKTWWLEKPKGEIEND